MKNYPRTLAGFAAFLKDSRNNGELRRRIGAVQKRAEQHELHHEAVPFEHAHKYFAA